MQSDIKKLTSLLVFLSLMPFAGTSAATIDGVTVSDNQAKVIQAGDQVETDSIDLFDDAGNSIEGTSNGFGSPIGGGYKTDPINYESSSNSTYGRRVTFKRGSSLAWSKDNVEWYYNSSKITSSSGWQEVGYVWPNKVTANGISKYYNSTTSHKYRASKTISAGIPTPWGDVNFYSKDYIDTIAVYKGGSYSIN